jgi:hypothetical protein
MVSMKETATGVVTFLVVAVVGLVILNAFWSGVAPYDSDLNVSVEDNGTAVGSGEAVELYTAENDTLVANETTNSDGEVYYNGVDGNTDYYLVHVPSETQSNNLTADNNYEEYTWDYSTNTLTETASEDDAYRSIYETVETTTSSIYNLLLILPIVLVGAIAIRQLSGRLGSNRGR